MTQWRCATGPGPHSWGAQSFDGKTFFFGLHLHLAEKCNKNINIFRGHAQCKSNPRNYYHLTIAIISSANKIDRLHNQFEASQKRSCNEKITWILRNTNSQLRRHSSYISNRSQSFLSCLLDNERTVHGIYL